MHLLARLVLLLNRDFLLGDLFRSSADFLDEAFVSPLDLVIHLIELLLGWS